MTDYELIVTIGNFLLKIFEIMYKNGKRKKEINTKILVEDRDKIIKKIQNKLKKELIYIPQSIKAEFKNFIKRIDLEFSNKQIVSLALLYRKSKDPTINKPLRELHEEFDNAIKKEVIEVWKKYIVPFLLSFKNPEKNLKLMKKRLKD